MSGRLANAAMPAVRLTEAYRAALESAARGGIITDRERDVPATLQKQLGIPATEALAL